jgi:hypothetical protein
MNDLKSIVSPFFQWARWSLLFDGRRDREPPKTSRPTFMLILLGISIPMIATFNLFRTKVQAQEISPPSRPISQLTTQGKHQNKGYEVKVFFAEAAAERDSLNEVEAVRRETNSLGVARFAIQELIEGPTPAEQRRGLTETIELAGESTCGGQDFTINLEQGVATLQFCRQVVRGGVGDDVRIENAINKTLKQFPTIQEVRLLNLRGDCLIDFSGENRCFSD